MAIPNAIRALIDRADQLTRDGVKLLESKEQYDSGAEGVDEGRLAGWFARAETLVRAAPSAAAHYVDALERARTKSINYVGNVVRLEEGVPVIGALAEDLANGPMSDVRALVRAEVFNDLLEQAEHLLDNGYDSAAAVLAGAVLEDHLRVTRDRDHRDRTIVITRIGPS